MSTVRAYNLEYVNVSAKGENAALVHLKIRQAQDLIEKMDAMKSSGDKPDEKQIARDKYLERRNKYWNWVSEMRWREEAKQWNKQFSSTTFEDGNYTHRMEPTIEEQDELIRKLRYKLLHKCNSLAEEKKLMRQIKEAEEIRETLVAHPKPEDHHAYDTTETNTELVQRAVLQKLTYERNLHNTG